MFADAVMDMVIQSNVEDIVACYSCSRATSLSKLSTVADKIL